MPTPAPGSRSAICALLCCLALSANGEVFSVTTEGRFTFVGKFSFDTSDLSDPNGPPEVQWHKVGQALVNNDSNYRVVFYSDEDFSWPAARAIIKDEDIWKTDPVGACDRLNGCPADQCGGCMMKTCTSRNMNPICPELSKDGTWHCTQGTTKHPYREPIRQQSRPRIWYVGITNCEKDATYAHPISAEVTMINQGGFFRKQFGVDHQGILEFCFIIVPIFSVMAGVYCSNTFIERKKQGTGAQTHAVVKWFIVVIILQLLYYMDKLYTYWLIAESGKSKLTLSAAGFLASVMYLMLIINFATGFAAVGVDFLSRLKDPQHRIVVLGLGGLLIGLNLLLLLWELLMYDPMSSNYDTYQSWPAVIMASLRIPIAVYFVVNIRKRVQEIPESRDYYMRWGALFFFYIISLPFLMMLAFVVSPHVKFRVVDVLSDLITVLSMCAMSVLLWPGAGLTVVLSNTYTITDDGDGAMQHMPMQDDDAQDTGLSRSMSNLRNSFAAPPADVAHATGHHSRLGGFGGGGDDDTLSIPGARVEMTEVAHDEHDGSAMLTAGLMGTSEGSGYGCHTQP